jgi:hypothetical protein
VKLALDRRAFLKAAGAAFAAGLAPQALEAAERGDTVFATAFVTPDNRDFGVAVLSEKGEILMSRSLPQRGHDVIFDRVSRRSVVFARQPGTFALVFDPARATPPVTIASAPGRHFFGHGAFSPDGRLLYATENDFDRYAGVVGVYDATADFGRLGEFETHGTGPHELVLLEDGRTLAIANGGIETHPDFGRAMLNLATMKPSLVFVDRLTGALLERHELPPDLHQLSIRHMATDRSARIWFGCTYEGSNMDAPQLVGSVRRGEELKLLDLPPAVLGPMRNYVGSVAANHRSDTIAVTSPQGNFAVTIDAATGTVRRTQSLVEVCGVAPEQDGFRVTSGAGVMESAGGRRWKRSDHVWDNHLLRIAA